MQWTTIINLMRNRNHMSIMFRAASQDHKILNFSPMSPSQRQRNKSTQLPYFKRFPNSKFRAHERKIIEEFQIKQLSSPRNCVRNRASFFQKEKRSFDHRYHNNNDDFNDSSTPALRPQKKSKLKEFFRQAINIARNRTQSTYEIHQTSLSKHKRHNNLHRQSQKYLTPLELLEVSNNLTRYEKQQIIGFSRIYYYGQNCAKKKAYVSQLSKEDGSYSWQKGDHIYFRYQIVDILGEGSFGQVFKCLDYKANKALIALKIVKDNQKFKKQAKTQVKILNHIKAKDPTGAKSCIHLRDFFIFRSRMCMTFDLLSMNLYQLIKCNDFYGLPLDLLRRISLQILNSLHFLHRNRIIHADLKPENVLLKEANKSGVKVIDFGSSCFEDQTIYTYIQSRYYRAPEVILGLPYDRKIDVWSFACIIAELHLGYPLFAGDQENQQMRLIISVLGMPPSFLANSAKRWNIFFDKNNHFMSDSKGSNIVSRNLAAALENPQDSHFVDFIGKCLTWRADQRWEALDCMSHPWILKGLPEQIKEQHLKFLQQERECKNSECEQKPKSFSLLKPRKRPIIQ